MVSTMESDPTPQQAIVEVERATATLWTAYPPTPGWYCPAVGAWCAALVLVVGGLRGSPVALVASLAGLAALSAWYRVWYTRYRGTLPRLGSAPDEFRPAVAAFIAGTSVVVVATALTYLLVGYVAAALLAFVVVTAGLAVYERAYATAAAATRARLG
jgi:hypothetical protein